MPLVEDQETGAVDQHQETALQTGLVQGLHADQTLDHLLAQARHRITADAADKVSKVLLTGRVFAGCRPGG